MTTSVVTILRAILLVAMLCLAPAGLRASEHGLVEGEGYVEVPGGRVWYEVVGSGPGTPLLLLHGGPGAPSDYLRPLAALSDERPVIFYDQLGGGRADRPTAAWVWSVDRYVEEIATVVAHLGLEDYFLYGHSWGTMVGSEFYFAHPDGIKGLIFAGPNMDSPIWLADMPRLIAALPEETHNALMPPEGAPPVSPEAYAAAIEVFNAHYFCRCNPPPPELEAALAGLGLEAYQQMWGPTEFVATGVLKDWSALDRLYQIDVPTLYIAGEHDEATPESTRYFASLTPGAEVTIIDDASHMAMLEQREEYVTAVRDFLHRVEVSADR